MYRRVVALVLLPCLLLTQPACFAHVHGGDQLAGHDLCPHFHANTTPHSHGHHHGHGGRHHHHEGEHEDQDPVSLPHDVPSSDHDEDAVYVCMDAVPPGFVQTAYDLSAATGWHAWSGFMQIVVPAA